MYTAQEPDSVPSTSPMVLPHTPHPDTRIPHAALPHHDSGNAHAWAGICDHLAGGNTLSGGVDFAVVG